MFQFGYIPLLTKEGWLRHPSEVAKPPKSRRRGGRSRNTFQKPIPKHRLRATTPSAPFSERIHFVDGASTSPLQGGECACPGPAGKTAANVLDGFQHNKKDGSLTDAPGAL